MLVRRRPSRAAAAAGGRSDSKKAQRRYQDGALQLGEDDYVAGGGGGGGAAVPVSVTVMAGDRDVSGRLRAEFGTAKPTPPDSPPSLPASHPCSNNALHVSPDPLQASPPQYGQQQRQQQHLDDDGTPMPLAITADETHLFQVRVWGGGVRVLV